VHAVLLEPHAGGRISGGYVYNARMTGGSPTISRQALRFERFETDLEACDLPNASWLIADSLFLTRAHVRALERVGRAAGHRLAMLLHAFPSFIRLAADRDGLARALPLSPSREELDLLGSFDLVIAPGPYVPRLLAESRAQVKTLICPPGVDPNPPRARRAGVAGPVQLVSIGGVTPLKGFLDAAEALGPLDAANFHWTIVGDVKASPEHAAQLRRRLQELNLAERVSFIGQRDHDQTLATLQSSDLLLVTSFTENHPLVALEALTARVPVVGYAVGGLPDIIRDGDSGCLLPLLDIARLSNALHRLIVDPSERQRLSEGCARAAAALPTWSEAANDFVRALEAHTV
jgi:glycosyltransferase involved in cell wall biosynthesis